MKEPKGAYGLSLSNFGQLVNAIGGGGNKGQSSPQSDADDLGKGLRFIPGEVTLARRRGESVQFVQECTQPCCWYWRFSDNSRTYYWERLSFEAMAVENGVLDIETDGAGKCSRCGNTHTSGGHIKATDL